MKDQVRKYMDQLGISEWQVFPSDMEKFAELIVRECMDVIDPGVNQVIARYQARQWLAEHFGIK